MLDDKPGPGLTRNVIARWGDAVLPGAPNFAPNAPSDAQADMLFPYDGVIAGFVAPPLADDHIPRLVMVVATPDIPPAMVFPGGQDRPEIAGRMQGATVLNLQYDAQRWLVVDGGYQSRRIADGTLCQITGPAAASIGATVQGVLAPNCGCATPWGTVLLGEGNAGAWLSRLAGVGYGYADPIQAPRFGWVVELNPLDPGDIPAKRTALGRLVRGGMAASLTKDGRPVIFFTENVSQGCLYRFIGASNAAAPAALDSGTLAVAKISGSGISWVNLGADIPSLVGLTNAAQIAGGSAFDAPGGLVCSADGAALYLACGGNAGRSVADHLNPRAGDDNGHIIRFDIPGQDASTAEFSGAVILAAGNPAITAGTQYPAGAKCWLRQPRQLGLDAAGTLWIGTDQRGDTTRTADGLFTLNNNGALNAAYLAPIGAAMGGSLYDAATHTLFAMVRHPGAIPGASFASPATRWPSLAPTMPPQSTMITLAPA